MTRDLNDLHAAFDLIERRVDDRPSDLAVIPLRAPGSRRALRAGAALTAAASVVGITFAVAGLGHSGSTRLVPQGAPTDASVLLRSVPFTLAPDSGLALGSLGSSSGSWTAGIANLTSSFSVSFGTSQPGLGLEAVTINGAPGYYDDGSEPLTSGPGQPSPGPGGTTGTRGVIWEYEPGSWAQVTSAAEAASREALLHAARSLTITPRSPLGVSFQLSGAPDGGTLASVSAISRLVGTGRPPYTSDNEATVCEVRYSLPQTSNQLSVTVESKVLIGQGDQSPTVGVPVTVDGHAARWDAVDHQLIVDLGKDVHVRVAELDFSSAWTQSLQQLEDIVPLVDPVSDVADSSSWVPATTALP